MSGRQTFKPNRTFSKRMLVINNGAAWIAIFLSIWLGQGVAGIVVPAMAGFLFAAFGAYIDVGHLDMRAATGTISNQPADVMKPDVMPPGGQ